MRVIPIGVQSFGANTYAIIANGHAFAVDPTVSVGSILSAVSSEGAVLDGILLTHGHYDHLISLDTLRDAAQVPAYIHASDAELLTNGKLNAFYAFFGKERTWRAPDGLLSDGDELKLGGEIIKVIHTPGHTQGSVCYLCGDTLISGDTLFADNVGRCDLYGGCEEQLIESLDKLRGLDGKLKLYAGHGPDSTLGEALSHTFFF